MVTATKDMDKGLYCTIYMLQPITKTKITSIIGLTVKIFVNMLF